VDDYRRSLLVKSVVVIHFNTSFLTKN